MSTWGRRGLSRGVRNRILDRDNHTCQLRYDGCTVVASEVDDIVPVATLGGVSREQLTDDNRQAACSHCHAIKTERFKLQRIQESAAYRDARRHLPRKPHPGEW